MEIRNLLDFHPVLLIRSNKAEYPGDVRLSYLLLFNVKDFCMPRWLPPADPCPCPVSHWTRKSKEPWTGKPQSSVFGKRPKEGKPVFADETWCLGLEKL